MWVFKPIIIWQLTNDECLKKFYRDAMGSVMIYSCTLMCDVTQSSHYKTTLVAQWCGCNMCRVDFLVREKEHLCCRERSEFHRHVVHGRYLIHFAGAKGTLMCAAIPSLTYCLLSDMMLALRSNYLFWAITTPESCRQRHSRSSGYNLIWTFTITRVRARHSTKNDNGTRSKQQQQHVQGVRIKWRHNVEIRIFSDWLKILSLVKMASPVNI